MSGGGRGRGAGGCVWGALVRSGVLVGAVALHKSNWGSGASNLGSSWFLQIAEFG